MRATPPTPLRPSPFVAVPPESSHPLTLQRCARHALAACDGMREIETYAKDNLLDELIGRGVGAYRPLRLAPIPAPKGEGHGGGGWAGSVLERAPPPALRILSFGCGDGSSVDIPFLEAVTRSHRFAGTTGREVHFTGIDVKRSALDVFARYIQLVGARGSKMLRIFSFHHPAIFSPADDSDSSDEEEEEKKKAQHSGAHGRHQSVGGGKGVGASGASKLREAGMSVAQALNSIARLRRAGSSALFDFAATEMVAAASAARPPSSASKAGRPPPTSSSSIARFDSAHAPPSRLQRTPSGSSLVAGRTQASEGAKIGDDNGGDEDDTEEEEDEEGEDSEGEDDEEGAHAFPRAAARAAPSSAASRTSHARAWRNAPRFVSLFPMEFAEFVSLARQHGGVLLPSTSTSTSASTVGAHRRAHGSASSAAPHRSRMLFHRAEARAARMCEDDDYGGAGFEVRGGDDDDDGEEEENRDASATAAGASGEGSTPAVSIDALGDALATGYDVILLQHCLYECSARGPLSIDGVLEQMASLLVPGGVLLIVHHSRGGPLDALRTFWKETATPKKQQMDQSGKQRTCACPAVVAPSGGCPAELLQPETATASGAQVRAALTRLGLHHTFQRAEAHCDTSALCLAAETAIAIPSSTPPNPPRPPLLPRAPAAAFHLLGKRDSSLLSYLTGHRAPRGQGSSKEEEANMIRLLLGVDVVSVRRSLVQSANASGSSSAGGASVGMGAGGAGGGGPRNTMLLEEELIFVAAPAV